jgi:hypothetical protein
MHSMNTSATTMSTEPQETSALCQTECSANERGVREELSMHECRSSEADVSDELDGVPHRLVDGRREEHAQRSEVGRAVELGRGSAQPGSCPGLPLPLLHQARRVCRTGMSAVSFDPEGLYLRLNKSQMSFECI